MSIEKIIYVGQATVTGGRDGRARSSTAAFDLQLGLPKEMGGSGHEAATNPEQLFAAGYAACFLGALNVVAHRDKSRLPKDAFIDAAVGIGAIQAGFALEVTLSIHLSGMQQLEAQRLVAAAHEVCPYSNATRGNIDVTLNVLV